MKQKKLSEVWYLQEKDRIEVNGKSFEILEVDIIESYNANDPSAWDKTLVLTEDYYLEVGAEKLSFGKIERPSLSIMK